MLYSIQWRVTAALVISTWMGNAASCGASSPSESYAKRNYTKSEHWIEMRDGVKLYTAVYRPKQLDQDYPILLQRTPYSCSPYGPDQYRDTIGPSRVMMEDGYIVVYQDVRGRYQSEGQYDNMRPHVRGKLPIDESSDTYDTIEWLLANVPGNNGKVGQWGISYPGFYAAAALPEAHPALVAASPQAPIADFYFDDFHHGGAFTLMYWQISSVFGYQKQERTTDRWYPYVRPERRDAGRGDAYEFYLELGSLANSEKYYGDDHVFWQQIVDHPNYDEFWQSRNILPHLENLHTAVLVVGGWFDAEDLYGPLHIYQEIEANNLGLTNHLVMGPWSHGDWSRTRPIQSVAQVDFGEGLSEQFQREVELRFFQEHLKGIDHPDLPEALVFDTGRKRWLELASWPPVAASERTMFLGPEGTLAWEVGDSWKAEFSEFPSDPANPVPYRESPELRGTPRPYMAEDQRFAARRPDVLVFQTEPLAEDLTLTGPIVAHLQVATDQTDADWVVKLIDVYSDEMPNNPRYPEVDFRGYQQMVRSEVLRGRFRRSFEQPEPFIPQQQTAVDVVLQDVCHTFRRGHRLMIQIQSTWFPLVDRNPQQYVENIYRAKDSDFVKAMHRVYHSSAAGSQLELMVLEPTD